MSAIPPRVDDGRRVVVVTAAVTGLLLLAVLVAVLVWAAPRHQVAVPGPDASPQQVVEAYVDAVAARDFDTARTIDASGREDLGRLSRPGTFRDVRWGGTQDAGDTATVTFTADLEGGGDPVAGGTWTAALERYADGRWRIVGLQGGAG